MNVQATMDEKYAVGSNVWYYRTVLEMTQEKLSERSNISVAYISKLERGEKNPTVNVLRKLASALNVQPEELLNRDLYFERTSNLNWTVNLEDCQLGINRCPLTVQRAIAVLLNFLSHYRKENAQSDSGK